jgi:hypothetical protein
MKKIPSIMGRETVLFHLYEILKQAKLIYGKTNIKSSCFFAREKLDRSSMRKFQRQ